MTVINAVTAIDNFLQDPTIMSTLTASAAVANAVSKLTALEAGVAGPPTYAQSGALGSALGGAALFYTGVQLIRTLTYDQDYSRSDGIVAYKQGKNKFETTFLNGADGGSLAYTLG